MNLSTIWLRTWANPQVSDKALAQSLTMAGLEVDGIKPIAPAFEKVVVGQVIHCEKHPHADKLNVCQVDIGESKNLQIICGAKNIQSGLRVIVATIGAKLPNGLTIKKAKLRMLESFGMICSEAELGMTDSSTGIAQLADDAVIGQNIRKHLQLDEHIIELDITPNRGDCFSVLGIAREVCVNYNLALKLPHYEAVATIDEKINTQVDNPVACPKYLTRVIKGIDNTTPTPQWITRKLIRSGQALHSAIVDITNFVLLELGQPMHVFDLSKINGNIKVRAAQTGEKIELLNEQTVQLRDDTLVIADNLGVLAIAGVMGGINSATQTDTIDILLESAFFAPISMVGKARSYGLHTESSLRFERGVDFNITKSAMERATQLIIEIAGGQASVINECVEPTALPLLNPILITKTKIQQVLGFELETNWIEQKFERLDFKITGKDKDSWTIVPPSFRFDIRIPADLIEELARLYGYDKLPVQKLSLEANIHTVSQTIAAYDIAQALVNRGYQEVINYSFIAEKYQHLIDPNAKKITLNNPISTELSTMRSSLWAGLLQNLESNQRRGYTNAKFFELGLCFEGLEADLQSQKIAGIITGNQYDDQWSSNALALDFYDAKADVESLLLLGNNSATFEAAEHPALQKGQSAKIILQHKQIGWIGALSPKIQKQLSLSMCYLFEVNLNNLQAYSIGQYQTLSAYQKASRDIALVVDEDVPAHDLINCIKGLNQPDLVDISLFDVYNVEVGKKSLAFNLSYQSTKETLSDEQVNNQVLAVLALMREQFSAIQRV